MDLLMNGLLMAATLFAGGYCWVLGRRVRELKSLDSGLGGSIVALTRQVELARLTLEEARAASRETRQDLAHLATRADAAASQLKLLIAAAPTAPAPPVATPAAPAANPAAPSLPPGLEAVLRPPAVPEPEPQLADLPKPRALVPIENPLRRAKISGPTPPSGSEDAILDALTALAGGER